MRHTILGGGQQESKLLGHWDHMLYKLNFLPNDPKSFITTHYDGRVRLFDMRDSKNRPILKLSNSKALSAAFCPSNPNYFVLGGGDIYVRLFDMRRMEAEKDKHVRKYCPKSVMDNSSQDMGNLYITGVDFNPYNEILANYSGDDVYLFNANSDYVNGWETSAKSAETVSTFVRQYKGRRNVQTFLKEVSFVGGNEYVATGSDCGNLFIWEKESGNLVQCLKADKHVSPILCFFFS